MNNNLNKELTKFYGLITFLKFVAFHNTRYSNIFLFFCSRSIKHTLVEMCIPICLVNYVVILKLIQFTIKFNINCVNVNFILRIKMVYNANGRLHFYW